MAVLCGSDIVKVSRVQDSIEKTGEDFLKKIYTQGEIEYCESRRMCKFQSYAARVAAKEAVFKAISPMKIEGSSWQDIEVYKLENGNPKIHLYGYLKEVADHKHITDDMIDVSLSHDADFAIATAVIEYNEKEGI